MAEYIKQEMSQELFGKGKKACYRLRTYSNWDMEHLLHYMCDLGGSSMPRAMVVGVVEQLADALTRVLSMGHSVTIDGLGTFRLSLGVRKGKEQDAVGDEQQRNARSIVVRDVLFKADPRFVSRVDSETELTRGGTIRIHQPQDTLEERVEKALLLLERQPYMTVTDYMLATDLTRNRATLELRRLALDPASPIAASGRGSHRVYVRRQASDADGG